MRLNPLDFLLDRFGSRSRYIPSVIFGAESAYYAVDRHVANDRNTYNRYRPKVRVTEGANQQGAVNLNLFPMSEEGPVQICVHFPLEKRPGDDDNSAVWWRYVLLHASPCRDR